MLLRHGKGLEMPVLSTGFAKGTSSASLRSHIGQMWRHEVIQQRTLRVLHLDEFHAKLCAIGPPHDRKCDGKGSLESRKIYFQLERLSLLNSHATFDQTPRNRHIQDPSFSELRPIRKDHWKF